jgi:aspartate-semialdehyde dehydrogenase
MSPDRIPCAILGASGYIGQHFARILSDHPEFEVVALGSGEHSRGRRLSEIWQLPEAPPSALGSSRLLRCTPRALARAKVRLVFSALPSGTAARSETELAHRGFWVFTNAADHRMDAHVPLLVPEVNGDHLGVLAPLRRGRGILVANPNCSATGLVLSLAPVLRRLGPRAIHVSTFQSLSGAGYPGVPSLAITDNVIPFVRDEESKLERESARMLGQRTGRSIRPLRIPFVAHCARVGTREGHLEAVTVVASRRPDLGAIRRAWGQFDPLAGLELPTAPHPPIELRPEEDRPQPLRDRWAGAPGRARGMAAVIGRVRWDPPYLRFFVLSHNAVRGGAGASVLNAEFALARLRGGGDSGP